MEDDEVATLRNRSGAADEGGSAVRRAVKADDDHVLRPARRHARSVLVMSKDVKGHATEYGPSQRPGPWVRVPTPWLTKAPRRAARPPLPPIALSRMGISIH